MSKAGERLTIVGLMNAVAIVRELYPDAIPLTETDRIEFYVYMSEARGGEIPVAVISVSTGAVTIAGRDNEYTRSFPDYDNL